MSFDGPLDLSNLAVVRQLRSVLDRHGFTTGAVVEALGSALPFGRAHQRDDLPLYLRRVAAPTPINTLVKLFVLDRSVDAGRAAQAFAPIDLDDLRDLGLIEDGPRGVRSRLRLSMHEGLILAHDAYDEEKRALRPDHVLDVNPTTISLSNMTVRKRVPRALEIGTGCGALALAASRHCDRVVATDTNPRALNLAAFNAAINGISNVEWRMGSLFDAVEGETFDLIFCNPPYVISPDSQFIFRDGGRRGDALCEEIVRRAPRYLNDGGFCTVLINWAIPNGQEWHAPLRRWVDGNGCQSWLMMSASQDPTTYAAIWTRSRDRDAYAAALDRWIRYFEELDLQAIGLGAVVLRKSPPESAWVRVDYLPDSVTAAAGADIERLFGAHDYLASVSDEALLAGTFKTRPEHSLLQTLTFADGRYVIDAAEVRSRSGLPFRGTVDPYSTQLLARSDGTRTLAEIAREIAGANDLDPGKFTAACAGITRGLIASGFLVSIER
ncbi:MAG TPA: class I SAM-dependent methyltransferase [Vicinamibacterales bacterium]